ncbi:hypothetical protein NVV78_09860 [Pediococcus ethanolidurans]|uniref:Uncharacterized protein n=1 Tax=Companilactobacillus pabuli TaxID=2714036 RepID=A0A7L7L0U6_9LACO|nr:MULTISPECIES: hypothetical protein [Lactobacillaceae]MCT4398888.1 hypothetical protein [Pediococcus ethanolidurans]MCV3316233.1 hypothetical protein [Pediococcus ethanolidurans]MCV3324576.1 hypothetical protein [Pediococcus ethanolidurans]MCV3328493.1 hypothetical protein [Pediococcus ethanolidurans]MCV3555971.1 hypothetical protein [Pediococcus ethanolidurans]
MQIDKLTLKDVATTNRQYLETIFALGDGHMGVRDSVPFTGNQQATLPVMLINGYYATNPITYGESAYQEAPLHSNFTAPEDLSKMVNGNQNVINSRLNTDNLGKGEFFLFQ